LTHKKRPLNGALVGVIRLLFLDVGEFRAPELLQCKQAKRVADLLSVSFDGQIDGRDEMFGFGRAADLSNDLQARFAGYEKDEARGFMIGVDIEDGFRSSHV